MVGRSEKNRSLGRCPSSLPLFETDPKDENQTTQQGQEHTTGPDPHTEPEKKSQRPGPPTQPRHQETRARKRAHRPAGEPGSFPHVLVRLEGRDTGCTTASSRVPVLVSRLRNQTDPARESFTGPPSGQVVTRNHLATEKTKCDSSLPAFPSTTTAGTADSCVEFNTFGSKRP